MKLGAVGVVQDAAADGLVHSGEGCHVVDGHPGGAPQPGHCRDAAAAAGHERGQLIVGPPRRASPRPHPNR